MRIGIITFAVAIASLPAQADIYKCKNRHGDVSFQARPCADNLVTEWQQKTDQQKKAWSQSESEASKKAKIQDAAESWVDSELPAAGEKAILDLLNTSLKNPASLKDFEIVETVQNDTGYRSYIRYRATNSYGAYGLDEKIAEFDLSGNLTDFRDKAPSLPIRFQ